MPATITSENVLLGHTDEASAYVVDDYPYGYNARTQIRYWIESAAKKGDRMCSQTLNPKTGRWNKPKKSTYSPVGVLFLDEIGHVKWTAISTYADDEWIATFLAAVGDSLSEIQKRNLAVVIGMKKAFAGVKWTVKAGPSTPEDAEAHNQAMATIARRAAIETRSALEQLG